ncbi:MAG: pentapeptide repeat-containing protein [Cohaesibacter sp.]|jgi:uncharacterized protein YjbI with pentapeptide repeats|nr:pentapeptide repeat-containing protein [Cohaesibacter sp.]
MHKFPKIVGALLVGSFVGAVSQASAWTANIKPDQDVNTICELKAGSQCTGAVRIEAQLEGRDLSYASMPTMRLDRANLRRANLFGTILQLSNLKDADLTLANLERAHLHGVNLQGANMSFSNLQAANFLDADLRGANLTGANLEGAIFTQAKLGGVKWPDGRVCASHSVGSCK